MRWTGRAMWVAGAALSVLMSAGLALNVQAQAPAPLSELARLIDIPHEKFTLDNGLRVIVHTDRKAPVVAVSVWYGVGSKHEPKGKTGFAHLFEHLMFNGSENAPGDYFEPLQQVGATDFNGTTWLDRTNYFQTVPTGALERALFLESDRMGFLLGAITQEKLDNQRGVVQNEKRQGDNQPYGLVGYLTFENLFPKGHPYHHSTIGSMADLNGATLEDVRNWFKAKYGPNNAVLVLAGDIDVATAKTLVEKYFGAIKRGPGVKPVKADVPTHKEAKSEVSKDRVATTRLYRYWTVPGLSDADAVRMQAAASVLGGLSSSRLDNALVRQEKIAVAVTAGATIFQHAGVFQVSADVKPGTDPAVVAKRLDAVIAEFVANGPTADELSRAATGVIAQGIRGFEAVGGFGGKAVALAEGELYLNDSNAYKKELAQWAALTPEAVKAAAAKWLSRPVYALTIEPGERTETGAERGGAVTGDKGQHFHPQHYVAPGEEAPIKPSSALDRSKLPEVGSLAALDFPDLQRAKLSNGIEVVLAQRSGTGVVNIETSFDAGSAADPKSALGTQSLMLSLMTEGTLTRTSVQIAEETERLGAALGTSASADRTEVSAVSLKPNLAPTLDLLADIVRNPKFDPSEVERLRAQQLARIKAEFNNPAQIASRTLRPILYGEKHPYGNPPSGTGDPAVVAKLTPEALRAFHGDWLRPENARFLVSGDVALADLVPLLEKSFGNWKGGDSKRPTKSFAVKIPAPKPRIVLVDRPKSPQSVIAAGSVLGVKGREDLVVLRAANEVYGGTFLARINMNLRETKGWSYGVNSGIGSLQENVPFTINAPVQADKTGAAITELRNDLTAFLTTKGVTPEELQRTINGNVRRLPGSFETSGAVLAGVRSIVNLGRPDNYFETLAAKYSGMTAAEIDAEARKHLDPKSLVYVVVGDASVVKPQLDGLGLPVEVVPAPTLQ